MSFIISGKEGKMFCITITIWMLSYYSCISPKKKNISMFVMFWLFLNQNVSWSVHFFPCVFPPLWYPDVPHLLTFVPTSVITMICSTCILPGISSLCHSLPDCLHQVSSKFRVFVYLFIYLLFIGFLWNLCVTFSCSKPFLLLWPLCVFGLFPPFKWIKHFAFVLCTPALTHPALHVGPRDLKTVQTTISETLRNV